MILQTLVRGDVVLTRFPCTDLPGASLRPAVVVSQGHIGQDIVLILLNACTVFGVIERVFSAILGACPRIIL